MITFSWILHNFLFIAFIIISPKLYLDLKLPTEMQEGLKNTHYEQKPKVKFDKLLWVSEANLLSRYCMRYQSFGVCDGGPCKSQDPLNFNGLGLIFGRDMRLKFHYRGDVRVVACREWSCSQEISSDHSAMTLVSYARRSHRRRRKQKADWIRQDAFLLSRMGEDGDVQLIILMLFSAEFLPHSIISSNEMWRWNENQEWEILLNDYFAGTFMLKK